MTKGECFNQQVKGWRTKEEFTEWFVGAPNKELPPRPSPTGSTPEELVNTLWEGAMLGHRSIESKKYPHLINLMGMFYLGTDDPNYEGRPGRFKVKGTGWRYISPGNAGGGSWDSMYRYFCILDNDGNPQVVSFAVIKSNKEQTMLIVAVDREGESHNSLQLDLDRFVTCAGDTMQIWHDGTLTRGRRGSAKRDDVLRFVGDRDRLPQLVRASRIRLGSLPLNRLVTWKDAEEFVYNCIEYALVRDEFRREPD